jgi:phosphoribosylformylglycinamidine synthase
MAGFVPAEIIPASPPSGVFQPVTKARITVTLKNGVLDPQGKAIEHALEGLGFGGVGSVRQGKVFDVELAETDKAKAEADLKAMCDRLLANTVIENYSVAIS